MLNNEQARQKMDDILDRQKKRVAAMRAQKDFIDYATLDTLIIGVCGGDGIGPVITRVSEDVLRLLLADDIAKGRVAFRTIDGLTLENRIAAGQAIPDDVLAELKACHVVLKGPTTTPDASYTGPNIESANVAMRRELDLFANVRPVKVPQQGIDWTFFRENTEGAYAVGSLGFEAEDGISVDFTITTTDGTRRIAQLAFDYAQKNGKTHVAIVTKANVIKATDGKFLRICNEVAEGYPGITAESWYADIMTAKLVDEKRRRDFQVMVLPNLYGDIITDEAAEFQGGVGTAGSANIGKRYAMFEAIHGSAPRMVAEGRGAYADPCSMLRAGVLLLRHIGKVDAAARMERALDICMFEEKKLIVTGRPTGATSADFGRYVMDTIARL
ncbi:MAG: isocitrate/isopropylmalate family dehydrogenase [Oscillospiraceae bacterium]